MSNSNNQNEFFKPNWQGLNLEEFSFEFGDEIALDSQNIRGIILDFSEDEGGKWYGVCFMKKEKIFGRQIPSGFSKDCTDLLDLTLVHQSIISDFTKKRKRNLDVNKVEVGGIAPVMEIDDLVSFYEYGIAQRNKEQTPCRKKILELNPVNECYFEIAKIEK